MTAWHEAARLSAARQGSVHAYIDLPYPPPAPELKEIYEALQRRLLESVEAPLTGEINVRIVAGDSKRGGRPARLVAIWRQFGT